MPTLSIQPGTSLPIPKKECLLYGIIPYEALLDEGTKAVAVLEFDGTAYAAGQEFIFAGQTFFTTGGALAFDRFEIDSDALASADRFIDALALNAYFFGFVTAVRTQPVPGTYRVTVTWIANGAQPDWLFDYSGMSPEPSHSETNGALVVLREGFKLRYQLWSQDDDGIYPVTNIESIVPRVTETSAIPRLDFDFGQDVLGLVRTTWPGTANDIAEDETFTIQLFLKYGGLQVEDCEVTEYDFLSSNVCTLVNSVFQLDSEEKMKPHIYPESLTPKFLTARPANFAVRSTAYYFLWIYAAYRAASSAWESYRAFYEYKDKDGVSLGTQTSASTPTTDGVYIVPAGPMNSPGIPSGTATIEVRLEAYNNVFETWIPASEEKVVRINNSACKPTEFIFLEDLGAYSIIYATEPDEIHTQEHQVFERPEYCSENVYNRDAAVRVRSGGRRRANIISRKRYRCKIYGYDDAASVEWFRQFRDSEDIKHRYVTAEGVTVMRNIILDAEEVEIAKEDDYLTMEFTFTYHTDLR